jgi:hypothetical protein
MAKVELIYVSKNKYKSVCEKLDLSKRHAKNCENTGEKWYECETCNEEKELQIIDEIKNRYNLDVFVEINEKKVFIRLKDSIQCTEVDGVLDPEGEGLYKIPRFFSDPPQMGDLSNFRPHVSVCYL